MNGDRQPDVRFEDVTIELGGRAVLRGASCSFPRGGITVLLGGSGRGKTTLLRAVGGLIPVASGRVWVLGRDVAGLGERELYEVRASLGMMFQNGALLDSSTVFDNLALPLREHTRLSEAEIAREVHECLASVGLSDVDRLLPRQLSGGMTKRAALARAILMKPRVLLCDEPFSGLDPSSARRIEALLVSLCRERDMTVVIVSHDIPSTLRMADHVVLLLEEGTVEGSPAELRASADEAVAAFFDGEGGGRAPGRPLAAGSGGRP